MFYAVGDIHGYSEVMLDLLYKAGLINMRGAWAGGMATLVFVGDFVDRGPDSIGTIKTVMRLQKEAQDAGGTVLATLGNHDLALLLAKRYPDAPLGDGETFQTFWHWIGGVRPDLKIGDEQVDWVARLPAMLKIDDTLILHADSTMYLEYGSSVEAVNRAITGMLETHDTPGLAYLSHQISQHQEFWIKPERAAPFLETFGVRRLLHGHTPIHKITRRNPESVRKPLIYAAERCINIDGGIYLGGRGFVWRSDEP